MKKAGAAVVNLSMSDAFALLGLTPRFFLERTDLEDHLRRALVACHPDRFTGQEAAAQDAAARKACDLNHAFSTLKDPLKRAHALCALLGHTGDLPPLDSAFLGTSFMLQEEIESDPAQVLEDLTPLITAQEQALEEAFSRKDTASFTSHLGRYCVLKRLQENAHAVATS